MKEKKKEALIEIVRVVDSCKGDNKIFLIGGFVRDLLRDAPLADYDIDFTVEGDSSELVSRAAQVLGGKVKSFPSFFTYKIQGISGPISEIDFAETRSEIYKTPGSLPVVARASLIEDLKRRDFTINTLALPLEGIIKVLSGESLSNRVIDRFNGCEDLINKTIRILHPKSFKDDPTRIFRAARYVARLTGSLSDETKESLVESVASDVLHTISGQRRWNEIKKILSEKTPSLVFRFLADWGIFRSFPICEDKDFEFFLNALKALENKGLLTQERGIILLYGNLSEHARAAFEKESGIGKKVLARYHDTLQSAVSYSPGSPDEVTVLATVLCNRSEKVEGILRELKERGIVT